MAPRSLIHRLHRLHRIHRPIGADGVSHPTARRSRDGRQSQPGQMTSAEQRWRSQRLGETTRSTLLGERRGWSSPCDPARIGSMTWRFSRSSRVAGASLLGSGVVLGTTFGLALSQATAQPAPAASSDYSRFQKVDLFAKALALVEQHYVRPVDDTALIYAAIDGLMDELDPHSGFLDPREAELLREDIGGKFGGVGLVVKMVREPEHTPPVYLEVSDVITGGPASAAGVDVGDRIVTIEGKPVAHFARLDDAIAVMRGAVGTRVEFQTQREGQPARTIEVIRGEVDPPAVEMRHLGEGIGLVQLAAFQQGCAREVDEAIDALAQDSGHSLAALVLDMRDNGGGLLGEAVAVADMFLDRGVIVRTRSRGEELVEEISARRRGTRRDLPLVVLINKGSASATEIVAGALQDHRRALLVGERSYGKGSVQSPFTLHDGSMLKLTTALYYTPRDRLIQAAGVIPDVLVGDQLTPYEDTRPDLPVERDVPGHLRPEEFGRSPPSPPGASEALAAAGDDAQLRVAVEHARAFTRVQPPRRRRRTRD
ncbi:MAG: S41 family peptidase [Myxococcales bacterium FL481]|nr:MAG: S41 family peptidase [Myxococcales bacterium FL481]